MRRRMARICLVLCAALIPIWSYARAHGRSYYVGVRVAVFSSSYASPPSRPPGWDRGRKTGWGDCDLPPGQAKKFGCYGYGYGYAYRPYRPAHRTTVISVANP